MVKKPTRYYSNRQERSVAKAIGGRQTANSGATKFSKGDVRTAQFLIECKTLTKEQKSMKIQKDWIIKNSEEAFAMNRPYSAISINFGDGENYYIISEQLFITLCELLKEGG